MIPTFTPHGEAAMQVSTPLARELLADLSAAPLPGVLEAVPALDVLTVLYDPLRITGAQLGQALAARLARLQPRSSAVGRTITINVTFDGPDLSACAARAALSPGDFVAALCAAPLEVAFVGFTPGFAFLSGLPPLLQMPRRPTPRQVAAGSVALGGPWAGIYPSASPGGWQIVGHTNAPLFDLSRPEPVLLRPGDRVRLAAC